MTKLFRISLGGNYHLAIEKDNNLFDLSDAVARLKRDPGSFPVPPDSMIELLENWPSWQKPLEFVLENLSDDALRYDKSAIKVEAPIARPPKIMCVAFNNKLSERFMERYHKVGNPGWFLKAPTCVIGPGDDVELPPAGWSNVTTPEVELGVVVGKRARWVERRDAFDVVAGYTIVNDITAQDLLVDSPATITPQRYFERKLVPDAEGPWEKDQLSGPNRIEMKQWDTFAPIGPCIVTRDEVLDPYAMGFSCKINGSTIMEGSRIELIWDIPEIIHKFSTIMTLEPGDLVVSGNLGKLSPKAVLKPGDTMEISMSKIGTLSNRCVASGYPSAW